MAGDFEYLISGVESKELLRTLTTLFETRAGSQPADRDFGISWECLDEPPEVAENLFFLEAVKKVERYEPRLEIVDIEFTHGGGGRLIPCMRLQERGID